MSEEKDEVAETPVEAPVEAEVVTEAETEETELEDLDFDSEDESEDEDESLTEDKPEAEEESQDQPEEGEGEEPSEDAEEETQEGEEEASPEPTSEELRKQYNDEQAKRRIAEKKLEAEKQDREQETLKKYLDEAKDDEDLLAQRRVEVERHLLDKERSLILQEKVEVGVQRAIAGIDILREGSPEEKEEMIRAIDDYEKMYIVRDQNGNIRRIDKDVTEFLQDKANSIRALTKIGARQQVEKKTSQKSKTMAPPSKAPKEAKADPDLSDFDSEWE